MASIVAQLVKNLPAMRETWVRSLGWEDPLEKRKATHSSILAWRIPWIVVCGAAKSNFHFHFWGIREWAGGEGLEAVSVLFFFFAKFVNEEKEKSGIR